MPFLTEWRKIVVVSTIWAFWFWGSKFQYKIFKNHIRNTKLNYAFRTFSSETAHFLTIILLFFKMTIETETLVRRFTQKRLHWIKNIFCNSGQKKTLQQILNFTELKEVGIQTFPNNSINIFFEGIFFERCKCKCRFIHQINPWKNRTV